MFSPSGKFNLLTNIDINNNYKDSFYFNSVSAQTTFFLSKIYSSYSYNDFTYIREENTVKVPINIESIRNVNYVMYQNANFTNKWFYAFVNKMEYMSDGVTKLYLEQDVLQTWLFEMEIKSSFVEREHVDNDEIGIHTVPENLETGAYVTSNETSLTVDDLNIYMLATESLDQPYWNDPAIVGGFPVSCFWLSLGSVSNFSVTALNAILSTYATAGKIDAIVAVFTAPANMISTQTNVRTQYLTVATRELKNYTPKNNKLLTYPYCCLEIMTTGQAMELRYENFDAVIPTLQISGGFGVNPQIMAFPKNYEAQVDNLNYVLTLKDFPLCAWVSSYFQNWIAQNKANLIVSSVNSAVNIGTGAGLTFATGGELGLTNIASGVSQAVNLASTVYQQSIIPDKMEGSANAGDIMSVSGYAGFYTYCRSIKPEYAEIIDNFFEIYGYKINKVKIPNIHSRTNWNYIKLAQSNIYGNIPNTDLRKINSIFENGLTFWHNDNVCNYNRSNTII